MQPSKTARNAAAPDAPQRTSPATPKSTRVVKAGGNDSESSGIAPAKTPTERSPKMADRRSPKSSPADTEKKRSSRISGLETQVGQLQEELKKTKEQLSSLETSKRRAQHDAEETKKQLKCASSKLEESQKQLVELSARHSELETSLAQQDVNVAALSSLMAEIQRLKRQLELATDDEAAQSKQCEQAAAEVEALQLEIESRNSTIESLTKQLLDAENTIAEAEAAAAESKEQCETAKSSINTLCTEGIQLRECVAMKESELEEATARIGMLEDIVRQLQQSKNAAEEAHEESNNVLEAKIEQLRSAAEEAEMKHQEEQMQKTVELRAVHELLNTTVAGFESKLSELEAELNSKAAELAAAKEVTRENKMQLELEKCVAELKASLADRETALEGVIEENGNLRSEARKYEAAVAELELAKAAEQDVRMRLGYVTEEADKSSRHVARVSEQLEAAQAANAEMEAELRRLRVQTDQWRKAAEAAAAVLAGGGGGGKVDRAGSMDPEYNNSIGGKLMNSPFSDELDGVESPKRRSVLRRMSGLWKKSPAK